MTARNEVITNTTKKEGIKKTIKRIVVIALIAIAALVLAFSAFYFTRIRTMSSISKLTSYEDGYDIYTMNVLYDYDLDAVIERGITDDQSMMDAMIEGALPLLPVHFSAPKFGCSSFTLKTVDGKVYMGRNYDFKTNTSAMLTYCAPKNGYKSVAFAALSNLKANTPLDSTKQKMAALIAPYVCLDGINEKGVSISVLTLDSDPVHQDTGKKTISTSLAIRLVLDRAATTQEAVDLLSSYDMFASSGRDYHFYINDASGDGRAVEWDCDSETRELVATSVEAVTNFFALYPDNVQPGERNKYGHGKDRYEAIMKVFDEQSGNYTQATGWQALKAAAQDPDPVEITSNTQWSILYDNTDLSADIVLRRNWEDVWHYDLGSNTVEMSDAKAS